MRTLSTRDLASRMALLAVLLAASACGGGSGTDGGTGGGQNQQQLAAEIEQTFPFTANRPFGATYLAARQGSNLLYYFEFRRDATLEVSITTDTSDSYAFTGNYDYTGDRIRVIVPPNPPIAGTGPAAGPLFPAGLDEESTIVMPQFGLVAAFATPTMAFVLIGHDENATNPQLVNYRCPIVNDLPESYEENAVEFGLIERPFNLLLPGSIFRQRDVVIRRDPNNPRITRANGIYRTVGNTFYASFRIAADFAAFAQDAGVQLPVNVPQTAPFPDVNLLKGEFLAGGTQITIEQLGTAGACDRR